MRNFGNKNKWKNILRSNPVLAVLLVIMLVFAWSVFGLWGKMQSTAKNKEISQNQLAQLVEQEAFLSEEIEQLKTPEGVEEALRNKFGGGREGEGLIVIVEDQKVEELEEEDEGGFFSFFKNLFK